MQKEIAYVDAKTLKISEASEKDCKRFYGEIGKELDWLTVKNGISMIDEYLLEPNNIDPEWVECMKL